MVDNKATVHKNRKTHEGQEMFIWNVGTIPTGKGVEWIQSHLKVETEAAGSI